MATAAISTFSVELDRSHSAGLATEAQRLVDALGDAKTAALLLANHAALPLPAPVFQVLVQVLKQLAGGRGVSVVPVDVELTTQQAADILLVSRPYLVGLLEAGKIPFRKVGSKRRLLAADVLDYKAKEDRRRDACLADLAAEAQRLGLY